VGIEPAGVTGPNRIPAMVTRSIYLGNGLRVIAHLVTGDSLTVLVPSTGNDAPDDWEPGASITCHLPASAIRVLPVVSQSAQVQPAPVT